MLLERVEKHCKLMRLRRSIQVVYAFAERHFIAIFAARNYQVPSVAREFQRPSRPSKLNVVLGNCLDQPNSEVASRSEIGFLRAQ